MIFRIAPRRRIRVSILLSIAALSCTSSTGPVNAPAANARTECTTASLCSARLERTPGRYLGIYQNYPIDKTDTLIANAVVVIHGTDRDADACFQTMSDATLQAGKNATTIIISPRFKTIDDSPLVDEPYWTSSGWKEGDLSSSTGPLPRISSYAALDTILARLNDKSRFPKLQRVTVTGHSAGGQVMHRYAAASGMESVATGVAIRYVAANPSTYLYLTPERSDGTAYALPSNRADCTDYNSWHLGMQSRNAYASQLTESQLRGNLITRNIAVMVGTADTGTSQLDVSCGANYQGERRYSRGVMLMNYMRAFFPTNKHQLVEVPGVGHSSRGMYTSARGQSVLFP